MADATHRVFIRSVERIQGYEEFRVEFSTYKAPQFPERRDDRSEFRATLISIQDKCGKYESEGIPASFCEITTCTIISAAWQDTARLDKPAG